MDVSNQNKLQAEALSSGQASGQSGPELVDAVVNFTGLPETLVGKELGSILESAGHSPDTLTLDQLRAAMVAYLESTLNDLEACEAAALDET
jgi:hypothetical protein